MCRVYLDESKNKVHITEPVYSLDNDGRLKEECATVTADIDKDRLNSLNKIASKLFKLYLLETYDKKIDTETKAVILLEFAEYYANANYAERMLLKDKAHKINETCSILKKKKK